LTSIGEAPRPGGRHGTDSRETIYAHFEDRRELLLALLDEAGEEALSAIDPFLAGEGPVEREELAASVRGLLQSFRRQGVLVRAVVEAAGYDDEIGAYWDGIVGRFAEAARHRLRDEGLSEDEALATATALVWMNERICYRQVVRDETGLDDAAAVGALCDVWWSVLQSARARAETGRALD
jgi:AcrR family transcriptional regulator